MPLFVKGRSFLRNLFLPRRVEVDLDQEVQSHLEMLTEENIRAGMPPEDAQRAARIELGGIEQVKEQVREERIGNWLHSVLSDCRYGLRMLRKNPGFAAIAILTLAMGIGANTAIFSVVQGVVLAPLPYPDPDRLVLIRENTPALQHLVWVSYPDFLDWQRNARSFQQITALRWEQYNLTSPGTPEHLNGKAVSTGFFNTLGLKLSLGREFAPREDQQGGAPGLIISDRLWGDQLHGPAQPLANPLPLHVVASPIVRLA